MRKKGLLFLSAITSISLYSEEIKLDTVIVEESIDTVKVENVSGEKLKSADLG
jgi:hypothetical protein